MKSTKGTFAVLLADDTYFVGSYEVITGRRVIQKTQEINKAVWFESRALANGAIRRNRLAGAAVVSVADVWAGKV